MIAMDIVHFQHKHKDSDVACNEGKRQICQIRHSGPLGKRFPRPEALLVV